MYPVPIPPTATLPATGFSLALFAALGIAAIIVGAIILRAATVRLDADARR